MNQAFPRLHTEIDELDTFVFSLGDVAPKHNWLWKKGMAFFHLRMFERSIPYLDEYVQRHSGVESVRIVLAYALLAQGKYAQSTYHWKLLKETSAHSSCTSLATYMLACLETLQNNPHGALHYFEQISYEHLPLPWLASSMYYYALLMFQQHRYTESVRYLRLYCEMEPWDWHGPYMIGNVYEQIGDNEQAVVHWYEALQLEEHPRLLKHLALFFERNCYFQSAAHCFERLRRMGKSDLTVWLGLVWNYGRLQDVHRCRSIFLKASSILPSSVELYVVFTWLLFEWGEMEEAQRYVNWLSDQYAENPTVQFLLAHNGKHVVYEQ